MSIACVLAGLSGLFAQEQDETTLSGVPLENAITGRPLALRLRGEVQLTEDSDDVIALDPAYKSYPSRVYAAEAKLSHRNRMTFTTAYESWKNPQGLDASLLAWTLSIPLADTQRVWLRHQQFEMAGPADGDYFYAGLNGYIGKAYSSFSYRYLSQTGSTNSDHQVSEYLSWMPTQRLRIGTQAAVTFSDAGGLEPWYGRLFGSLLFFGGATSLRAEYQHYQYAPDPSFDEVKVYLYQKIGSTSFVRLGLRHYEDSNHLTSLSPDIKLKHYFSPTFAAHVGYRYYLHSEDTQLDTVLAGLEMLF